MGCKLKMRKLTSLDDLAVRAINLDYTLTHEEAILVWQILPTSTKRKILMNNEEILVVEGLGDFKIVDGK